MLTIQIKNGENEVIAVINDIFSLSVEEEINKGGKLKLRFPVDKRLQNNPLQKGYRISVAYGEKIGQIIRLFEGYITDVTLKTQEVQIEADNWLSYLQYRIIRGAKTYSNVAISTVISQIFTELNNTQELPIVLGLNDCDTTITKDFDTGTSFYDILKYCWEAEPQLVVRVLNVNNYNFLEVSKNAGKVLDGIREYDATNTRGTNIVDWSRKDSMDEFYSYIKNATGEINNEEFLDRTKLLFEKYEEEGALALPNGIAIPSISVSRDTDWWDFNIWDRKNIRLLTGYKWLPLEYQGLIQNRKVNVNANSGIKAEIKISEEYKSDTNILDLVLQNLRGRKNGSGKAPDMSDYYTKEQTAQVINNAVSGKADVNHTHLVNQITDFASAVWSLITAALQNYVSSDELSTILGYYSQVGHTHTTDDITDFTTEVNALIAEWIAGKADVNHRHTVADISDLDDTLADYVTLTALNTALADYVTTTDLNTTLQGYSQTGHTHAINDVTGLQNALNSKANSSDVYNKNDTYSKTEVDNELAEKADADDVYTKSETDTLLGGKANASHSHAISDVTNLQSTLNNKAEKTQIKAYTITEDLVTVTTDSTKGVAPYNTSYWYTNITIDANAGIEWKEWAVYSFVVNTEMVVASANRNVRVRIWDGARLPVMGSSSSIAAGSSFFTKANTRLFVYKTTQQSGGALHLTNDTTYSSMSVAEWQAGTATNARVLTAANLKQIIEHRIPTALSAFTNDTNFITNAVNDLVNYYTKSETYTKTEVNNLISGIVGITVEVVQSLPSTGQNGVIYLVPNGGSGSNVYDEYIRVASQNKYEKLGTTEIDLTNYIQKTDNLLTINGVAYKFGDSVTTPNTEYDTLTASEISTGTATIGKLISAKLLKDAIDNAISGKADSTDIKDSTIAFKINNSTFSGNSFTLNQATGATINLTIDKTTVGLGNVDNTADANKRVAYADEAGTADSADYATNAGKVNNHTVDKDVPSDAKFTDTTYNKATANADGLMSKEHYSKLEWIEAGAEKNKVTGVKGSAENEYREGNVNITKANIWLWNVDNTADTAKPVSTAQKTYIDTEVGKKYNKLIEVTVSTAATTAAKVGTTTGGNYVPTTGDLILVNFVNGCNVNSPTLNIDSSGAKNIRIANANASTTTFNIGSTSSSNVKILLIYDGTYYKVFGSQNNTTYTVSDSKITLVQDGVELWYFTLNQGTDKTISWTSSGDEGQINATMVQNMIDIALGNYDNVFKTNSWLYKILNAIDEEDECWLTEWETRNDIINDSNSMDLISHSYAVMVNVSNSQYAMEELMEVSGAVNQISQCWNSIYIIAENNKSAEIYLSSPAGIQYLFQYQTAQDAFFTDPTKKQQIISQNIMVIVNNNTLLAQLYNDPVVEQCIASNQTALTTIAGSTAKLDIVDGDSVIMDAICRNSGALGVMSNTDFTNFILENTTYLTTTTSVTAGQNRINSMAADDLLPAIFYYTGLSWYSTFADLAASDSAISIVQANANCMVIINNNDEAKSYLANIPSEYQEVEYIQSDGNQLIKSGVYITTTGFRANVDFQITSSNPNDQAVIWYYIDGGSGHYRTWYGQNEWFTLSKGATSLERQTATGNRTTTANSSYQMYLFAKQRYANGNYDSNAKCKFYSCQIYNSSDTKIRDFYACYRKSDNVVGLYDKVNGVFYTNQGSGSFTKWPNYER